MYKKILLVAVPAISFLAVGFVLVSKDEDLKVEEKTSPATSIIDTNVAKDINEGKYVDYSEGSIAEYPENTKILFFHASWCPQCRELDESIVSGQIPENVVIMKVDYDDNQSLRSKYGVTIQTTLVRIDDNGELIEKFVAYDDPNLTAVLENLL